MTVVCCTDRENTRSFRKCQKDIAIVCDPVDNDPRLHSFSPEKLDGAFRRAHDLSWLLLGKVTLLIALPHLGLRQVERGTPVPQGLINDAQGSPVVADRQSSIHNKTVRLLSPSSDWAEPLCPFCIA